MIARVQQLINDSDTVLQKAFGNQLNELKKVQDQCNHDFQEELKQHLIRLEEQVNNFRASVDVGAAAEVLDSVEAAQYKFEKFRRFSRGVVVHRAPRTAP